VAATLDRAAERLLSGLTGEPAWPTLRGHLLLLAAAGADPVAELLTAAACRPSSMNRCGDHGTCELASWKALKLSGSPYKIGYLPVTVRFSGWRTSRL
jgi:hypothetical protein